MNEKKDYQYYKRKLKKINNLEVWVLVTFGILEWLSFMTYYELLLRGYGKYYALIAFGLLFAIIAVYGSKLIKEWQISKMYC